MEKKKYVKPAMTVVEVKMEPLMQASYDRGGDAWGNPFN